MPKPKLSSDGRNVLKLLQEQYGMTEEAAVKMMQDGGAMLAVALLKMRKGLK